MEVLQKNIDMPEASDMLMSLHCQTIDEADSKFEIEYDILPPVPVNGELSELQQKIVQGLATTEEQKAGLTQQIDVINGKIDQLTNHADGIDYAIAVTCGVLTGLFDSIFVGEWDFQSAKAASNKEINEKVMAFAQADPEYAEFIEKKKSNQDPNRLDNAISFLEQKYKLPGDGGYKAFKDVGVTDMTHHLDDFCHHPTIIGLICCILVQFTGTAKYRSSSGTTISLPVEVNEYGKLVSKEKWGKVFAGIINWFFILAQTAQNRKGHLLSDMAGSSSSAGKGNEGAGLPGSFLSTAKELSALPCFKDTAFAENLRKAYQNGIGTGAKQMDLGPFNALFSGASSKLDMRTEMAVGKELKRQSVPIIMNEILVRSLYFVRRFIQQMKAKQSVLDLDWRTVLPFNNRTIERMITIATGTFTAVDLGDAAIRSAVKSGGFGPAFAGNFILRVNFVGIGRFAVAVGTDVTMGLKLNAAKREKASLMDELIQLSVVQLYYKSAGSWCCMSMLHEKQAEMFRAQGELWLEVEKTEISMIELSTCMEQVGMLYARTVAENQKYYLEMKKHAPGAVKNLPELGKYIHIRR